MRTLVAGNWKMHDTVSQALDLVDGLLARAHQFPSSVEVAIAPPFTALQSVCERLKGQSRIALGAQTMHWEDSGPFTGEISPPMLRDFGVSFVIIGHSERRAMCGETDDTVNKKVHAALNHGITPIIAVGETIDEKNAGQTKRKVVAQTQAALRGLSAAQVRRVVMAYEPIWAIGTGLNDDPANADATMQEIRSANADLRDVAILYGGSVKPENMSGYAAMRNVNGALVGGASLAADSFAAIVGAAISTA
ncbi:MAG: triose-phosphate isomerase [Candidatus Eremiobacteraeota bacterium]|nr:triose-phosphate isomerase [Candidatus Eremiobacteraeota bacterium]